MREYGMSPSPLRLTIQGERYAICECPPPSARDACRGYKPLRKQHETRGAVSFVNSKGLTKFLRKILGINSGVIQPLACNLRPCNVLGKWIIVVIKIGNNTFVIVVGCGKHSVRK